MEKNPQIETINEGISYILKTFTEDFDDFRDKVKEILGLECSGLEKGCIIGDERIQFKSFLQALNKAIQGFSDGLEAEKGNLQHLYSITLMEYTRLNGLPTDSSFHRVWYGSTEPTPARLIMRFGLNRTHEPINPLEELIKGMLACLKSEKNVVGALLNYDGVDLVWIQRGDSNELKEYKIRRYSFNWGWESVKIVLKYCANPSSEEIPHYLWRVYFCQFFFLIKFFVQIIYCE